MREAVDAVATGEVTIASRDVQMNGIPITKGDWLGLADGEPGRGRRQTSTTSRSPSSSACCSEPRELLTAPRRRRTGPSSTACSTGSRRRTRTLEVDVQDGGQPHYHLLLAAE